MNFKNKKVLVMGLGVLGGGIAATKWLVKHGAKVTVTDLKNKKQLKSSIRNLGSAAKKITLVLGRHRRADFENNEIIVVNPGVPRESKFLKIARPAGAKLENEASIFFRFCENPIIAVTGTRGKTTTVNWIHFLLKKKFPHTVLTGNSSDNPMLKALDQLDHKSPLVVELSSWHLELLPQSGNAAHVAVITNLYPDHLNRYPSMKSYALAKANIFKNQTESDFLLLNKDNSWTKFFRKLKPVARIVYFPTAIGLNLKNFNRIYGKHNFYNLNVAILVARHFGVSLRQIRIALKSLPQIKFRQETVLSRKNIRIINDTTATTPEATIAAIERFKNNGELILITGGTDKKLVYGDLAKTVKKYVPPANLFLLNGSATKKMVRELKQISYFKKTKPQIFEDLRLLLKAVENLLITNYQLPITILFSPAAASFEKFKNEFDRGEKFNRYSKKIFSRI